jgi:hypothetical protein
MQETETAMARKTPVRAPAPLLFRAPPMPPERVAALVEQIQSGKFSAPELTNLYDNASERGQSSVMEAVEQQLRTRFPATARRKFGSPAKA